MTSIDPKMSKLKTPETMAELCEGFRSIFENDFVDIDEVRSFMESYDMTKDNAWKNYAIFDKHKYTRNLIDEGNGKYNLMILCWNEDQTSTIHDHADAHCFMKMAAGSLVEQLYSWPTEEIPMTCTKNTELKTNSVAYINDTIGLHRVSNVSKSDKAVSLHLYSPPFQSCKAFHESNGKPMICPVTFFTKFGQRTRPGRA
jgi:cysteine dioxygenase